MESQGPHFLRVLAVGSLRAGDAGATRSGDYALTPLATGLIDFYHRGR